MKLAKFIVITILFYAGIVAAFESMIGIMQPESETTLVITTKDASGDADDRVLARLDSNGDVYVAANHWPRDWYEQALENPKVEAVIDGKRGRYLAVPVSEEEHESLSEDYPHSMWFRFVTGFPPRHFLRLEPR